jgi:hypothetical protein
MARRFFGAHIPLTYEAVKAIAYTSRHFSSRRVVVWSEATVRGPRQLPVVWKA